MKATIQFLIIILLLVVGVIIFRFYEVSRVEADIVRLTKARAEFKDLTVHKSKGLYIDGHLTSRQDLLKLLDELERIGAKRLLFRPSVHFSPAITDQPVE